MDSTTCLDYALFQLTPTRTRCDLVIFAGKQNEKLVSGLLEPFLSHLKSAKDQISRGGYSITLRPSTPYASWFTKATFQRFVKFVTTPEVLERFVTIEREIMQIENEQANLASQVEGEFNGASDTAQEENPKIRVQRSLETRKAVLRKEQAMAYARALVSGFETDYLDDLITFANAFGAMRLREACISFLELCNKKSSDGIWLDEVAAMQACCPPSEFSYFEKSGEDTMLNFRNVSTPKSTISHGSSDTHQDNSLQTDAKVQLPNWQYHFPQYMQNFHGPVFPQMPPFPGYNFPPSYFPGNVPWHPNPGDSSHEPDESWQQHTSFSKKKNGKNSKESGSDSDDYVEHKKGSSRKVVIRNINYIAPKRYEEGDDSSGDSSSEYRKGQVEEAIAAFEKSRGNKMKKDGRKRNSIKSKDGIEDEATGDAEKEKMNTGWNIFQNLLMQNADSSPDDSVRNQEETFKPKILGEDELSPIDAQPGRLSKQHGLSNDSFIAIARDLNNEENFHMQNWGAGDIIPTSNGDYGNEKNKKDVLVDESLMFVQARPFENPSGSQPKADIFMDSDIVDASQPNHKMPDRVETTNANEPDDLCMVLERDLAADDQVEASWNPEMESLRRQSDVRQPDSVVTKLPQNGKIPNKKSSKGPGVKSARKETYSRTPVGSPARSKAEITSLAKKSPSGTPKSKAEKDEENRKKMEELALQRQRRIAERSSGTGAKTPIPKKITKENKPATSVKVEKPKLQAKTQVIEKSEKPVFKSSTIDRLSATRRNPVPPSAELKTNQNRKKITRENDMAAAPSSRKPAGVDKIKGAQKVKPSVSSSTYEPIMVSTPSEVEIKECSTENIKELHSISSVEKNEARVIPCEDTMINKNNDQIPNGKISALTEHRSLESAASEMYKSSNTSVKSPVYTEISPTELSTPPPRSDEVKVETLQLRKKWGGDESPPKFAKGIRKFLLFGRKS